MIGDLFRVMMGNPMLLLVLIVNVFLLAMIMYYLLPRIFGKKKVGAKLRNFFGRFFVRIGNAEMKTIEPLYEYVMKNYLRRGIISADLGKGFKAREKVLEFVDDEEKKVVQTIFNGYESKKYGGGVWNEEHTVGNLLTQFRDL